MTFENLLDAFRRGGNDTPYVSIHGQQAHIEQQFENYGIDMCDVLQLLKQNDLQVKQLEEEVNKYEVHGRSVDGEDMALVVWTNGNTFKLIDVWLIK